jgi:tRNA nucleotidyltransferase (CCA-adding enzyme)
LTDIRIPEKVNRILAELQQAGYEAYAVGGCVRDSLLGREPNDWDITTSAKPEQVKALFRRTVDTGIRHGTVTVMAGKDAFEVTTYRIDGTYEDGRHPDSVTFTASLAEDLKRRDFTINALAYNPKDGLVDLFDGTGDMQRKVIRAVGDPQERFSEDALRIMRAVRFSAQLGYSIDAGTREAIEKHAPDLRRISAERIHAELTKLLVSPHPDELRTLYETGISAVILPELDRCMSVPQNNPHHCYTVGKHIIHSVTAVRADETLRYTMLFHDLGKAACRTTDENGIDHFYGHAEISADLAYRIMRRLKFDNATADRVYTLVKYHGLEIAETPRGVRRAAVRVGADLFPLLFEVKLADAAAQSEYHAEEKRRGVAAVRQIYEEILSEKNCLSLKELAVSGSDLIAAGMKPGKGIGEVLRIMLEDVLETPEHNEKQYLLEKYRNMVENGCKTR